ncbi:MAG: 3-hydroxyacyl-CoA dehydrogenase [Lachnospiraceae bacterium]|nr:3-hydroxyacyl-CoA dehydrogenase [Lachnospiraceae bacterium]MEE3460751.1 3-hydroxyacyl-CoA dehydrogenase [Lachnospiraceae bacterium]
MFKKVVVAGGGVLGVQIALMCAYTGHDTVIWLRSEGSIGRTEPKIKNYSAAIMSTLEGARKIVGSPMAAYLYPRGLFAGPDEVTFDKIDEKKAQAEANFKELLHIELDLQKACDDADIVIEAMSEDPDAKTAFYKKLAPYLPEKTILLTNSSTLLPSTFAEVTGRPEKFCALHFANEIWKMNTAEVMGHPGTDPAVYEKTVAFAREINMIPLELHKEQPGYILNSMLVPFLNAAGTLLAKEVADPETIDKTWQLATGAPAGPFRIFDVVGLETAYNITIMNPEYKVEGSPIRKFADILKLKIDKGEKGINFGKGFYDYTKK